MPEQSRQLDKEDVLLLLLFSMSGEEAKESVASITRVEKMMYLLQEETEFSSKLQDRFEYKPWKFGPFSKGIYESLDLLFSLDLLDIEVRELPNYPEYTERDELKLIGMEEEEPVIEKVFTLADRGKRVAKKLRASISKKDWAELITLKRRFEGVPLTALIQYVYTNYPETTSESVLDHLKPGRHAC